MTTIRPSPSHAPVAVLAAALAAALARPTTAQTTCWDFGSTPIAASLEASPVPLGCARAGSWPAWHLLTPPHRAPAPHVGFNPGDVRVFPRILVVYRCTGLVFAPVAVDRVVVSGYVFDQPEFACRPGD